MHDGEHSSWLQCCRFNTKYKSADSVRHASTRSVGCFVISLIPRSLVPKPTLLRAEMKGLVKNGSIPVTEARNLEYHSVCSVCDYWYSMLHSCGRAHTLQCLSCLKCWRSVNKLICTLWIPYSWSERGYRDACGWYAYWWSKGSSFVQTQEFINIKRAHKHAYTK